MTSRALRQPFALDPLIAEAKRRARQRRFLVAVSAFILVGAAAAFALELRSSGGGTPSGLAGAKSVGALTVPNGTGGIAVVVYGKLSVTTKTGFHIHGLPVTAASLSPGAHYVAAGIGHSLTELAPSGKRLWSEPVGKDVADCGACDVVSKIAWSPDGSRIAYLVRTRTTTVLHVVSRDGTHDSVLDPDAGGGQPSWRADSGAIAYIGAHARPTVLDLANRSRHVITWPIARSPATNLAFAPRGNVLAIGTETAALLVRGGRDEVLFKGQTQAVFWLGDRLAVSKRIAPSGRSKTSLYTVTASGAKLRRTIHLPGPVMAAYGRTIAVPAAAGAAGVLAGPITSLHRVFRFTPEPWPKNSFCACGPVAFGSHAVSMG
jgi:hypothetical protein